MLLIDCPYCGARPEVEFRCGGEAHLVRPDPATADDAAWGEYLYRRRSPKGVHRERWLHAHGCGRWFNAVRDTASDRFLAIYLMGEGPPASSDGAEPT